MGEYITIEWAGEGPEVVEVDKYEFCAICNFPIIASRFPEDYPDDWKFCCTCLKYAELIIKNGSTFYPIIRLNTTNRFFKILQRITLIDNTKEKWKKRNEEWGKILNEKNGIQKEKR